MSANPEINPKPAIGQLSVDTVLLVKRLAAAQMGDFIPYAELNGIIGRNVQNGASHVLASARTVALRDHKIGFATVEGQGIRRMTDEELAESFHPALRHIRRTARKAGKTVACADTSKLTPEKQRAVSVGLSTVGAIELFTSTKSLRKVEEAIQPTAIPQKVNVEELTKLFAK